MLLNKHLGLSEFVWKYLIFV